jgi:hypothetical protein
MPAADGKLYTVDLVITVARIAIKVTGTIEVLDVRRRVE